MDSSSSMAHEHAAFPSSTAAAPRVSLVSTPSPPTAVPLSTTAIADSLSTMDGSMRTTAPGDSLPPTPIQTSPATISTGHCLYIILVHASWPPITALLAKGTVPASPLPETALPPPWITAEPAPPAATAALKPPGFPLMESSVAWSPPPPPPVGAAPAVPPDIFIGNVPLTPSSNSFSLGDKITAAFHNSSCKTLSFVPPSLQNGEVVVRPSINMIRNGSSRWKTTVVGYFLGKRPYFHHLNAYVRSIWPAVREVTATVTGFYFFQFKTEAAMEEVIEGGPWLFQGEPIVLQKWESGMALRKLKHTQVPVWIKLRHLPVELWTTDGLSTVASGIGKPLYPDAITRACTRLDFARVCVMLDISSKLPRHVIIMIPLENGGESACKVDVEYEWLPLKCTSCHSLGYATSACVLHKPPKRPLLSMFKNRSMWIPPPRSRSLNLHLSLLRMRLLWNRML
ncbi:UNVERIFIED_CONTAM: hypothetical protein Sradi_2535500 [Sesamum radiatum]|uniref:DUF4283 domain-containing protein n=1 Tax=Sesamum radiatum TaxID=300843 RepID=A0AAW2SM40_SESRA